MSIYIKGMEMPKYGCDNCFLRTGNYCGRIEKNEAVVEYARKNERHPDCPLGYVPPHGRLGDLDELYSRLEGWYRTYERAFSESEAIYIRAMLSGVKETPTIISADTAEEETE